MPTYIKTGFWEKARKGYKEWLNLDQLITNIVTSLIPPAPTYKVYTALLTQSGTTAPAATVLENTLGTTVTFSYTFAGQYLISFGVAPNFGKTTFLSSPLNADTNNWFLVVNKYTSPTRLELTTRVNGVDTNNLLNSTFIEIRVYN